MANTPQMLQSQSLKMLRRRLIVSTALMGGVVGVANVAHAQVLPDPTGATFATSGTTGGAPLANNPTFDPVLPGGTIETVRLHDNRTVIDWVNRFSVADGYEISFRDDRLSVAGLSGQTNNIAVLNRDMSGLQSYVYGKISSDTNVAVYLLNTNGILIGNSAAINTGSFFASTNNITSDNDFLDGNALRFGIAGTGGLEVVNGASITTTANGSTDGGRLGDLVLIGVSLNVGTADGTANLSATGGGDVALVAADDVTVAIGASSPLALTINRGTAVSGAFKVNATVGGRNVTMALATRDSVADAVLNVGGMVTANGAAVTDHGIVLTAGTGGDDVTLSVAPSAAPGAAIDARGAVAVTGTLDSRGKIGINALTGASTTVATTADKAVSIQSDGPITLAAITAGGAISVKGDGTKTFNGTLRTTAAGADGKISVDGSGDATFIAAQSIDASGAVALGQTTQLGTLTAKQITAVDDVRVRSFAATDVGGVKAGTLARFEATVAGVTLGSIETGGNFDLVATNGASAVTGAATVGGDYTIQAGALTLGSVGGTATQKATGAVSLTTYGSDLNAVGALTLQSGNAAPLTLASVGAIGFGTNTVLLGGDARQSDVQIRSNTASGAVTLGRVDARALLGAVGAAAFTNGLTRVSPIGVGNITLTDPLALSGGSVSVGKMIVTGGGATLTGSSITAGAADLTGALLVNATGAATIGTAGDSIKATSVDLTGASLTTLGTIQTAGAVSLHATSGDLAVTGPSLEGGSVTIIADAGNASVTGAVNSMNNYSVTGTGVTLGATATTVLQQARNAIAIHATGAAGITGSGALTLLSNNQPDYDFGGTRGITLTTDAGGIAFAPTTALMASNGKFSDVTIAATPASADVALGTVSARDLFGLNARGGAVTLGDVSVANGLDVHTTSGNIITGAISGYNPLSLVTDAGNLSTGALTSDQGSVTGQASGTVTTGAVNGRAGVDLRGGGSVSAGDVTALAGTATLRSTSGSVTAGAISTFGTIDVSGELGVTLTSAKNVLSTITLAAANGAVGVSGDVDANGALSVTARDAISAANLRGASLLATGASVATGEAFGLSGGVDITGTGSALVPVGNVTIATATASNGALTLTAQSGGAIVLGSGTAATLATLTAAGDVRADAVTANNGDLSVDAGGSVTGRGLGAPVADGRFDSNFGRTALVASGGVSVVAGLGDTLAQLGSVTHGGGIASVTAGAVDVRGPAINLTDATARIKALSLIADTGGFALGTGSAGTTAFLQQVASVGDLVVNGLTAGTFAGSTGDVTIRTPSNVRVATVNSLTGGIDISAGGAITGLALTVPAVDGRSAPGFGRAILTGVGAVKANATTLIQLGLTSGADICINGNLTCTDPLVASPIVDLDGAVTASGKLFAGGSSILLGSSNTAQTMSAVGSVRLVSTGGAITGGNGLTLRSDLGATGASLVLDATGGGIVFASGSTLLGGAARTADIGIRLASAGAALQLGTVSARSLQAVDAAGAISGTGAISLTGPVTLGNVSLRNTLSITTTGAITTGSVDVSDAAQGLTLDSGGNLTATGALTSQGNLFLGADGNLSFTTARSFGGTATVDVLGNATGTSLQGNGAVSEMVGGTDAIDSTVSDTAGVTISAANIVKALASAGGTGDLSITATNGSITGLAIAPAADGRPAATFGRTNLVTADGNITATATSVSAPGSAIAQLGTVTRGPTKVANVTADIVDVAAASVDLTNATARTGSLRLAALTGTLNLGSGSAGTDATLSAVGAATVSTLGAGGNIGVSSTGGAVAITDNVSAGGNYVVSGRSVALGDDAGAESQTAGGRVAITATAGAIRGGVGLTLQSNSAGLSDVANTRTLNLDATGGGILFDLSSSLLGGTARQSALGIGLRTGGTALSLGTVSALSLSNVNPALTSYTIPLTTSGEIVLGDVLTTNTISIETTAGSIRAGRVEASAGDVILHADAAGGQITGLLLGTPATDGRVAPTFGRADIFANGAGRSLTVTAANLVQLGTGSAAQNTSVTAGTGGLDATSLTATSGALMVTTANGPLTLVTGSAGTTASIVKSGGTSELTLSTLGSGGSATVTSSTNARVGSVTSTGGSISLSANGGDATGLAGASAGEIAPAYGRTDLTALGGGGNVGVVASGLAQLGMVRAGQNATVTANTGIDATLASGTTGLLSLLTQNGALLLGTGNAGTTALLNKLGTSGELRLGTIPPSPLPITGLTSGGDATVTSATSARISFVTSTGGNVAVTANGGNVTGLLGGPTLGEIAPTFGRANLSALGAGRSVMVVASGLAQLGLGQAGQTVSVTANTGIDATTLSAGTGTLSAVTQNGSLLLGSGSAGTTALLNKLGTSGELRLGTVAPLPVTGLTSGGDATVMSATDARISFITSTGGNVAVTTTGGNVTGLSGATPIGELAPTFGRANLTAGGNITVNASGLAQLGTGGAGQNVTIAANTGIDATTLSATAGLLSAITQNGSLLLGSGSAGTTATLDKRGTSGELRLGSLTPLPVTGLTSGGNATLTSATDARITFVTSTGGNVAVTTTGGNVTGLSGATPLGEIAPTFGRANLSAGGNITVNASGLVQLGTGVAGQNLTVNAATGIDATSLTATAAALSLVTLDGNLLLDTGGAGTTATLDKRGTTGELRLAGTYVGTTQTAGLVSGGTATLTSTTSARIGVARSTGAAADVLVTVAPTGSVTGLIGGTPSSALAPTYGRATLLGGRDVTVTAGPVAQLATVTAGRNITVGATALDVTNATATSGSLSLVASGGALTLGTGSAGTTATLTKTGAAGSGALTVSTSLTSGTVTGSTGTATLTSSTDARLAAVTAQTGNVVVTATSGAVTGASGGTPAGTLDAAFGRANLTASAATGSVTVAAGPQAQLGTVSAGAGVTLTAGAIDATALTATAGALSATASTGALTVSGAIRSGTTTALSAATKVSIQQANAGGAFTLSAADADLGGTLTAPSVTFTLTGAAANPLRLGGNSVADAGFELTAAELNRIAAANVTFAAGARAVEIKAVTLGAGVGSSRIDVLTTGAIRVTGALNAPTAGRTIRLGGTTASDRAATLQIVTSADVTSGGSVIADVLDLRADRIIAGQQALITRLGAISGADEINTINARFNANPQSQLYDAGADGGTRYTGNANAGGATTGTAPVFLTANIVSLSYGPYALFQNTGINGDTAGVNIGQLTGPSLKLSSTGATAANAFALFGRIGTVTGPVASGRAAALLGGTSIETSNSGSTDPRINPNNSRINGCLVGSGGGGCLITLVSTPRPVPFDLGQTSILNAATDLALAFDPLVGTSNEALFSDLGSIDLFSNEEQPCPPGSTATTCPKPGAPK